MKKLLAALCLVVSMLDVHAQSAFDRFPERAVRIVVPFPAGSTPDTTARLLSQKLSEAWKQPVIVENKPGAGGNIGTDFVAKSAPDGYTLLIGINGPMAVNKQLYANLAYDPTKDFAPISLLVDGAQILAVHPSLPVHSVAEFVAYAKANPGKLSYGSVGSGSASHLTMEMFAAQAGRLNAVHVPYKGFPQVVADLVAGRVQASIGVIPALYPHVQAGKLRAIGLTSAKRFALTGDLPTIAESGFPGFFGTGWQGLFAPAKTAPELLAKLNEATVAAMNHPEVRAALNKAGFEVVPGSREALAGFVASESERWVKIAKEVGAKAE